MRPAMRIGERTVGDGHPSYIVAEVSANHGGSIALAKEIMALAAKAGADAVKLQTYTADTMTLDSDERWFRIDDGPWKGYRLYDLYREAHTPWAWHEELFAEGRRLGVDVFSTPFDDTAVDLLERLGAPVYKIASFEITDLPLVRRIARAGKPVIFSTGMSTLAEIDACVRELRAGGADGIAALKCVSAYPAQPRDFNLAAIPTLGDAFAVVPGLSDHSPGHTVAVAAVALGARVIEKHVCRRRADGGPDAAFSMEPDEFGALVAAVRDAEAAIGRVAFGPGPGDRDNLRFRRSCFVVRDVVAGEPFTADNVRVIRPGHGLPPDDLQRVLGRRAARGLKRGTPLAWDAVGSP